MKNQFIDNARTQFLRETARFFNSYNRAIHPEEGCVYSPTGDSVGCAIGRHIDNKNLCAAFDTANRSGVANHEIFSQLPAGLAILGQGFLSDVQSLHDNERYWGPAGINECGLQKVRDICNYHGLKFDEVCPNL